MSDYDFDRYCRENGIKPGEEPAAFAAWLNESTGWDGQMEKVRTALSALDVTIRYCDTDETVKRSAPLMVERSAEGFDQYRLDIPGAASPLDVEIGIALFPGESALVLEFHPEEPRA